MITITSVILTKTFMDVNTSGLLLCSSGPFLVVSGRGNGDRREQLEAKFLRMCMIVKGMFYDDENMMPKI